MGSEDLNWFFEWETELPSPGELIPLSQSLITSDLALAFNISTTQVKLSAEFESPEMDVTAGGGGGGSGLKRQRLVWTPLLHKRFVDAVAHLGIKNAVPKTIMQLMSVDGLSRENVASHLQKYRLYLKRMQGISYGGGGGYQSSDSSMDNLLASSPVPLHFMYPNFDNLTQFVPTTSPHQHQMTVAPSSPAASASQQFRQIDNPFTRQSQAQIQRFLAPVDNENGPASAPPYVEDVESEFPGNRRKILTLFP